MNRRTFARTLAVGALSAAAVRLPAASLGAAVSPQTTPFPLSVMLWSVFNDLPFEQRLARIVEAGYTNVELVGEYNAQHWSPADFARVNEARKRLGIRFDATAGMANGISNPATSDAFLAELRQALVPMETLACPAMIVLSGNVVPGLSRQSQHQASIDTLKRAAAIIEGRQIDGQPVRLLLECIHFEENPNYFLTTANEAIEVIRKVNHPQVQFLYDIFHEQMTAGNLIEKLEKNIDVVGLIHIADVPGRHQPGSGEINYANIYRKLVQLNYRRIAAMEFVPTGDQSAALRAAKQMILDTAVA